MDAVRDATPTPQPDALADFTPPHPGSQAMPQWGAGVLPPAPSATDGQRSWLRFIGPAVVSGGAAIGGGEWLMGPAVGAQYGGAVMWLATLSILAQVLYNLEISRYALYSGEPIFTGKFRTLPGPAVWLWVYVLLDFGAIFPYLAANAATPLAAVWLGRVPDESDAAMLKVLGVVVFLVMMLPLLVGGKVLNTLKVIMSVKIVVVLGFLVFLALFFSRWGTWWEIASGFLKFGTVPTGGTGTANVFLSLAQGEGLPRVDLSTIALLAAFAAIAGNGGLTNTPISSYVRDQGWGMGRWVGAIPSLIGGQHVKLSHVGKVFPVNDESRREFRRWYRHVMAEQLCVWMPACFLGVALPSLLSVEFLPRGTAVSDWAVAGMTADGVSNHVSASWGAPWGVAAWYATLFCGFLVLAPTVTSTADGFLRRWVDTFWTASPRLRSWDPAWIKVFYFGVLALYVGLGSILLVANRPLTLVKIATNLMNFALGFSCWHALYVNMSLLPRDLRPGWGVRIGLVVAGAFFLALACVTTAKALGWIG